jgi:hypothetical protein
MLLRERDARCPAFAAMLRQFAKVGSVCAVATLGLALSHGTASASIINTGTINLAIAGTGNVFVSGNGQTTGCLDFSSGPALTSCQPAGSTGTFLVTTGTAPFTFGQTGTIKDVPPATTALTAFLTVGTPTPVLFDLTSVQSTTSQIGTCGLTGDTATGDRCELANSPFLITNLNGSVFIAFTTTLAGYTGTLNSGSTPFNGIFSTTIAGGSISSVLTAFQQNGSISSSWSASLVSTAATPEPGTFVLLGSALLGLGGIIRRNTKKV